MTTDRQRGARTVLVTGASSGIGLEVARRVAAAGDEVHALARRGDRLAEIDGTPGIVTHTVDVTDEDAVAALADRLPELDAVVHCAGGARGSAAVAEAGTSDWRWMWETNVLGTLYLLRALVPAMQQRGDGHVVVVTSVAAFEVLAGSSGYSTSKHAQSAMTTTLRDELLGSGVRVTEVCPGLVRTEFFEQRFPDDPGRAEAMFAGMTPLSAGDVAGAIQYALNQPAHVDVERIVLRPTAQGRNGKVVRS